MIESRLDSDADGIGWGASDGDLTVSQIAKQFQYLSEEARWRSVTGTLRILREQAKGRSAFASEPLYVVAFGALFIPLVPLAIWVGKFDRDRIVVLCVVLTAVLATFGTHSYLSRAQRKRSQSQLDELKRLALETLDEIASRATDRPRALSKEERQFFRSLRPIDREKWDRVARYLVRGEAE